MEKFIKTNDKATAEALTTLGYQHINNTNGFYIFMNSNKIQFSDKHDIDKSKIQYSNILTF